MKKILITFVILFSLAAVGCTNKGNDLTELEKTIKAAEKLSHTELVAKAKEEIGDNALTVVGNSSQLEKALKAFQEETGIKYVIDKPSNDMALYNKLVAAGGAKSYVADMILAQDGNQLQTQLIDMKYVQNFIPKEYKANFDDDDFSPATAAIYLNKVFMYNNGGGSITNALTNVWQLAGKSDDGKTDKISASFKPATTEAVNLNFLIMLTSPEWQEKLKVAYKEYYGTDYVPADDVNAHASNIGLKWVDEFIARSKVHSSDTDIVKEIAKSSAAAGSACIANYNKVKDIQSAEEKNNVTVAGVEKHISGFDGFVYKMYSLISSQAKYPLAAAAFISYLSSEAGYAAAWGGLVGYYSANKTVSIATGDQTLAFWKAGCVIEDPVFVAANYGRVFTSILTWTSGKK